MAEEKHSLISELSFDFSQATKDVDTLVAKMQQIDNQFKKTDGEIRKFNLRVGDSIAEALKELRGSDGQIQMDGSKIMRRIQNAFDSVIVSKGIDIKGLENTKSLKYEVPETVANKIRTNIISKIRAAINKAGVKSITIEPFTINMRANDMKAFRDQVQAKLNEAVAKNIKVDWAEEVKNELKSTKKMSVTLSKEHVDAIWKSAEKSIADTLKALMSEKINVLWSEEAKGLVQNQKFNIMLDANHLQNIVKNLETSVIEKIVAAGTVDFKGEVPKFKFPVEKFHEAFQKLQAELDELAQATGLEVQKVAQVPKLGNQLNTLSDGLAKGIGHIIQLSEVLNNKFGISGNEKSVKDITDTIANLKTIILNRTKGVVESLLKEVNETPASTVSQTEMREKIAQVHAQVNEKVINSLDNLPTLIGNALSNLKITLNPTNILGGGAQQTIEQAIGNAIIESAQELRNRLNVQFSQDEVNRMNDAFRTLSTQIMRNIYRETNRVLSPFTEQVIRDLGTLEGSADSVSGNQVAITAEHIEQGARQLLSNFGATVSTAIDQASEQVRQSSGRITQALEQRIANAINVAVQGIETFDVTIDFPVETLREKFLREARTVVRRLASSTQFQYTLDGEVPVQQVQVPARMLQDAVNSLRTFIQGEFERIVQEANQAVRPAIDEPQTRMANFRDEAVSLVNSMENEIRATFLGMVNNIIDGVRAAVPQQQYAQFRQTVEAQITSLYQTLIATSNEAVALILGITQAIGNIRNTIEASIVNALRNVNIPAQGGQALATSLQTSIDNLDQQIQTTIGQTVTALNNVTMAQSGQTMATQLQTGVENFHQGLASDTIAALGRVGTDGQILTAALQTALDDFHQRIVTGLVAQLQTVNPTGNMNAAQIMQPLRDEAVKHLSGFVGHLVQTMNQVSSNIGSVSFSVQSLHSGVRESLAKQLGTTPAEFARMFPQIQGIEDMRLVMQENIRLVMERLVNRIVQAATRQVSELRDAIRDVQLPNPDLSAAHLAARRMTDLQDILVRRVRDMINNQFNALTQAINSIPVQPRDLTISPPRQLQQPSRFPTQPVGSVGGVPRIGSTAGAVDARGYFPSPVPTRIAGGGILGEIESGGDTRTFTGAVVNTIRYMLSGMAVGAPLMAFNTAWESAKEFDYQMMKAEQNFRVKLIGSNEELVEKLDELIDADVLRMDMADIAVSRLERIYGAKQFANMSKEERTELVRNEALKLQGVGNDTVKTLQDIAIANAVDPEEVAKAFHIASRRYADRNEAIAMAKQVAKVRSLEEVDVEQAAKGFEAIGAQWGLTGYDMRQVANMMIIAANMSNATIEDLLAVQQRSGSLFRRNLATNPDGTPMTKQQALASSMVLSSMFIQATARAGGEGGTFFKAILERPFMREGLKAAEVLSQNKGFEFMNPYTTDANGIKRQKSFTEVFANIIAASQMMDDENVKEFFKDLFPQWHAPGVASMGNYLVDMEHSMRTAVETLDRLSGTKSDLGDENDADPERLRKTLEAFIQKVESGADDETTVAILRAMSMGTWKFQTQQIKTMWEVSTQGVFESLKDEFGQLNVYLLSILRYMRENANGIAEGIVLLTKIAAVMGAKFVADQAIGVYRDRVMQRRQNAYSKAIDVVNENGRYLNFKRMVQGDEIAYIAARQREVQGRMMDIGGRMQENDRAVVDSRTRLRDAAQRYKETYLNYQGPDRDQRLQALRNEIQQHGQNLRQGKEQARQLRGEYDKENRNMDRFSNQMNRAQQEMAELDYQAARLNHSMDALGKAMQDEGIDASKLSSQMQRLADTYQAQTLDARQYERQVRVIGEAFNMTEKDMLRFKKQLAELEHQLEKDAINERQFFQRVQNLERQHFATTSGIPGGGANGNGAGLFGNGFAQDALTLLGVGALANAVPKRGIFQRLQDFASVFKSNVLNPFNNPDYSNRRAVGSAGWGALRSFGALFGKNPYRRDRYGNLELDEFGRPIRMSTKVPDMPGDETLAKRATTAGVLGRMGKLGNTIGKVGSFLGKAGQLIRVGGKAIPGLGLALLGFEAFNVGWDVLSAQTMLDHENQLARAQKLQGLVKDTVALDQSDNWFGKALGTANFWMSAGTNALANLLGGNAPSWSESKAAWRLKGQYDGLQLEDALEKELGANKKMIDAQIAAQEYYERTKDPMDRNGDGKIDEEITPGSMNLSPEDVEQLMKDIQEKLQREMGRNESRFTIDQAKLLIQGVREDSEQMRSLMEKYLTTNIELLTQQLAELRERREKLVEGSDADKQLEAMQLGLEAQLKGYEVQLRENRFSRFNEIMNKLQEDQSLIENKYSIKQSDAIIGGASEDSMMVQQIETQKANELSRRIEQSQAELRDLLSQFSQDSREWKTIWMAIQQTEADQKSLLADISQKLGGKATFNLPSGIEPVSYMDYLTGSNSHRNVTMRQGDVTVNVTIGEMSGDPAAVKRMADEIAKQVKNAQVNVANSLSQQVKTGTGQNYTPMLDLGR